MRIILATLLLGIFLAITSSLMIYHTGWALPHTEEVHEGEVYAKEDVVVDFVKSIQHDGREKVICYRESHRNFYLFTFQLTLVIVALTTYGVVTKVRLSRKLQRQNKDLAESRSALDKTNEALLAGIRYAQRIQQAMLPSQKGDFFSNRKTVLFYRPKDLVSGDFYFVTEIEGKIITCAADSTGHGVSGAFLATLGLNTVRSIIENQLLTKPGEILRQVNNQLVKYLGSTESAEKADGIEMTIFCLDTQTNQGIFSGAKGFAFLTSANGITTFKGDKTTLGHDANAEFAEQTFYVGAKDWLLQTTDGFVDQFGGVENKKYGRSRFTWLLDVLVKEETILDFAKIFQAWKGDQPQVDDVLVLGYQV